MRCPLGQSWDGLACQGEMTALDWKQARKACPSGFRLPSKDELTALLGRCDRNVREGKSGKCSNCPSSRGCSAMFGGDKGFYWSSSSAADPDEAWYAYFDDGRVSSGGKDETYYVRCVGSGQ